MDVYRDPLGERLRQNAELDRRERELAELEVAVVDRLSQGFPPIGPLTADQQASEDAYERYMAEMEAEQEAEERAGGRTVCRECGERAVVHRTVLTYGVHGNPNSEYSDYGLCENCGHGEL